MAQTVCVPWSPPVFVHRQNAYELTRGLSEAVSAMTRKAFGTHSGRAGGSTEDEYYDDVMASLPTFTGGRGVVVGVTVTSNGKTWTKGSASYVAASDNKKLGKGQLDSTYVAISSTCVDCLYAPKGRKVEVRFGETVEEIPTTGICYGLVAHLKDHVNKMDAVASKLGETAEQASKAEADCIWSSYNGGPVPRDTALRIHVVGDSSSIVGTRALSAAVADWKKRGGDIAYTYTHAWRRVPRSAWGKSISVLASINPYDDVREARANGYQGVSTLFPLEDWLDNFLITPLPQKVGGKAREIREARRRELAARGKIARPPGSLVFKSHDLSREGRGLRFFPCPAQWPVDRDVTDSKSPKYGQPSFHEAMRFKAAYLVKHAKLSVRDERGREVNPGAPFKDFDKAVEAFRVRFDDRGLPIIDENHKAYARYREHIIASKKFPDPFSMDFKIFFRKISAAEEVTCNECRKCFDDAELGRRNLGIAFRPDKTSGGGHEAIRETFTVADAVKVRLRVFRDADEAQAVGGVVEGSSHGRSRKLTSAERGKLRRKGLR